MNAVIEVDLPAKVRVIAKNLTLFVDTYSSDLSKVQEAVNEAVKFASDACEQGANEKEARRLFFRDLIEGLPGIASLAAGMARLSQEQQIAVLLVGGCKCKYGEAAEMLELPLGTLNSRLDRGRKKLNETD